MKKHIVEVVILGLALLLLSAVIGITTHRDKKAEKEAKQQEEIARQEELNNMVINTAVEDTSGDLSYNYICGTETIYNQCEELPYNYYSDLAENVNEYLQSQGIKGKGVAVSCVRVQGYTYRVYFNIEDYDKQLLNEFKLYDWKFTNSLE